MVASTWLLVLIAMADSGFMELGSTQVYESEQRCEQAYQRMKVMMPRSTQVRIIGVCLPQNTVFIFEEKNRR